MAITTDTAEPVLSAANPAALAACRTGVQGFVHWRADTLDNLDAAIAGDDEFAHPRLVKAWIMHSVRDTAMAEDIALLVQQAEERIDPHNSREQDLLCALKQARAGQGVEAATTLESILERHPTDLLSHRLAQFELFWNGRSDWMRDITERAAPHWDSNAEGYGPFMSMRAFGNEEAGHYPDAERFGRIAIDIDQSDVWGAHAVAHVLLMKGQVREGVQWLEKLSSHWGHANQIRHHLWWHFGLFLLELGEHDRILDILTSEIRNPESPLVKAAPRATIDLQNFASLLMRLELHGVNVGQLWSVYKEICADRVHNHANAFINAHDMMVLAATGQFDKAGQLLVSMRDYADACSGSVRTAYRAAGIAVCEAILAHRRKQYDVVLQKLAPVRHELSLMGASHAQRDVFFQLLVDAARQAGRQDLLAVFLRDIERIGFFSVSDRAAYRDVGGNANPASGLPA